MQAIVDELKQIIATELDVNLNKEEISENAAFFEDGLGIDSIAIIELISMAEERFGIEFTDDDLVPKSFESVRVLAELIAAKIKGKAKRRASA